MNILLSAYACEPNRGSEHGNGWHWACHIAAMGYKVWCLTRVDGRNAIEEECRRQHRPNLHFVFVSVPELIDRLYTNQIGVYVHYNVWQRCALRVARKLDRKIGFHVVHHVTLGSFQQGTSLWRLNKPLIFGPVGGGQFPPPAFKQYFFDHWRSEVIRRWVSTYMILFNSNIRKTVKKARVVIVTNRETYEMAQRMNAKSLDFLLDTSLPEGFYPQRFPVRKMGKSLKLLWVGRVFARKGLPLALEALSKVPAVVPFELTIIGDGPLGALIPGWIDQYKLQERVTWRGYIPYQEIKRAYLEHDVFMFCSLRDSCPAQLLEAMAYGLPVITLDHHGTHDLVPDNAGIKVPVVTPHETVDCLARAVVKLHEKPELMAELGKNGYRFARTQTWPVKAKRLTIYYEAIAKSGKECAKKQK